MLWLNVYEGCLLPTNILSSTSPVSATVPRCPGRGTFLPSLLAGRVWWESRGRSVTASPPQFPAKCGHHRHQATSSPGHMGSGTRHRTSAPPPADTSTGAGLQGPRPVFSTPCPVEKKSDVKYFWCFLSWSIIGHELNQYNDREEVL